jgi:hypothetical protein
MQEGLKDLSMQEESKSIHEVIRKEVLPLNPLKVHQQHKATMLREDKNKNGKRNLEIVREAQIIINKARKLSKKKDKLENLQEVTENRWNISQIGTLQEVGLQDLNLTGTEEPCRMGLHPGEAI